MALKSSFVAPSHVVLVEDFGSEFEIDYKRHTELVKIRQDKTRLEHFPDVLIEDIWRIVDSFCWFAMNDIVTASVPISKLGRFSEYEPPFYLFRTAMDYFLGYEDGSEIQLSVGCVSGHFPFDMFHLIHCVLCIGNVDPNKRALVQFSWPEPKDIGDYYFIWTSQYAQRFTNKHEVEQVAARLGITTIFRVEGGMYGVSHIA